jgi:altronate dehydratase large subunit
MSITGFNHPGRGVGIRDHQLILPSVVCSTHISRKIASQVGAITFAHQNGCGIIGQDVSGIDNFFIALANHPNVQSTLVVSLGCETTQGPELLPKIDQKQSDLLVIQDSGGAAATYEKGVELATKLRSNNPSTKAPLDKLIVGLDIPRPIDTNQLTTALTDANFQVEVATDNSTTNLANLMRAKAHLIISFPDENQPPTGLPLIPVINIASTSSLHTALINEFDLPSDFAVNQLLELINQVANGQNTKSELSGIGEIIAPRLVRTT